MECYTVGVAGGSGAGKSAIAAGLRNRIHGVAIVDLDSYYLDRSGLDPSERSRLNFDEPSAFDLDLLLDHLVRLRAGHAVMKPRYCFESHTRAEGEQLMPAQVLVVEGLFALWWPALRAALDLKVFIEAPLDVCLARRIQRDLVERGRQVESILFQYLETVRPMYGRYVEPTRIHADLVLSNDGNIDTCVGSMCDQLTLRIQAAR
jgi:uridine kinase